MVVLLVVVSMTSVANAQSGSVFSPRKQVATIILSGLGGAVLGMSTLSFYGRPQDHLQNIALGFSIGVIGGASYTFYRVATRPVGALDDGWIHPHQLQITPVQMVGWNIQF